MSETIKFNPTVSPRKENIYVEEYYSGVDCNVYIDGKLFSNVSGISFQIQEQLKPLYGYASRTFDDVAIGNRIVMGSIQIPIVNPDSTDFSIDSKDKNLDLRTTEIASKNTKTISTVTNSSSTASVPDWVKEWMVEYGYDLSGGNEGNVISVREVFITDTLRAQQKLISLGYEINLNGIQDTATEKAVLAYQKKNGLNVTGTLDDETYGHLLGYSVSGSNKTATVAVSQPVRTGPSVSYPVFYTLTPEEETQFISEYGIFSRIILGDGRTGYIKTESISVTESVPQ